MVEKWKHVGNNIVILTYAYDMVVMGETRNEIINTVSKILRANETIGLRVNEEKAKDSMVVRRNPKHRPYNSK